MAGFGRIILQFFAIFTLLLCYVLRPKDKFWPIFPRHTMSIPMEFLLNQSINKIGNILKKWWWIWVVAGQWSPPNFSQVSTSTSPQVQNKQKCQEYLQSLSSQKTHPSSNYNIDIDIEDSGFMVNNVKQ